MDQVPARGHADLPLVQVRAPGAGGDRPVEVDVVEYHERGVAAQFEVDPLEVAAGQFGHRAAGRRGAGERYDPHHGVRDQRGAHVRSAGKDV